MTTFIRLKETTKFLVFAALILGLAVAPVQAQIAKTASTTTLRDALKTMLQAEGAKSMTKVAVAVSGEQSKSLNATYGVDTEGSYTVYNGTLEDGKVMGSVVIVAQEGKEGPLQAVIAIKPDGTVYDIGFTIFGEDKGKPAMNYNFLKQFMGKNSTNPVKIGEDIDGISGATWTSTSISTAVKRALAIHKEFVTK